MAIMDVKGVSWVEHMCQRFEALCVDVDEAIYEDTFVYVGNQMRTVGESVKKFYSEVMLDLLASSSLDSAKEKDALVSVAHNGDAAICKKQKLDNESEAVDTTSENTGKSSAENQLTPEDAQSQFADLVSNKSSTIKNYLNSKQEQEPQFKSFVDLSSEDSVQEFTWSEYWSNENEVEISGDIMEGNVRAIVVKGSQTKGASVGGVSTELDNSVSSMKAVADTTITKNIQDVEVDDEFFVSGTGADKQGRLKLEESCVLVEKVDHFSKSTHEGVQKSYKKKIREVFSPRRWSKSKRGNHEQLDDMYEEQCGKILGPICMTHTEIQNSATPESFENEWELL